MPAWLAPCAPIVVSNDEHRFLVAEQLREVGIAPNAQILEPVGRNTAPAVAAAAMRVAMTDPDGVLLVLPADHLIRDVTAFHAAVAEAARIAQRRFARHVRHPPDRSPRPATATSSAARR